MNEINDCTNNQLFDVLTSDRLIINGHIKFFAIEGTLYLKKLFVRRNYPLSPLWRNNTIHINGSFEAFKVLIGFLYFRRLIIKDKNDFKLIRKVCELSQRYSINHLLTAISDDLKNRINFENLNSISKISFDFDIKDLIEKVFEFIQINIEEVVKRDVEQLISKTNSDLVVVRNICKAIQKYKELVELKNRMAVLLIEFHFISFDNLLIVYEIAFDFNIEDLITNIKTFINDNISQLSDKNTRELIKMNDSLHNIILEVMAKQFFNKQSGDRKRQRTDTKK